MLYENFVAETKKANQFTPTTTLKKYNVGVEHFSMTTGISSDIPNYDYSCLRDGFVAERTALGYPQKARNVAIVNGSDKGVGQGFNANQKLVDIYLDEPIDIGGVQLTTVRGFDMKIYAAPGNPLVAFEVITKVESPRYERTYLDVNNSGLQPYDSAPGCMQSFTKLLDGQFNPNQFTKQPVQETHCFMPTISTLDISTNDLNVNIFNLLPIPNGLTPFESFYAPDNNEYHVQITQGNRDWLNEELTTNNREITSALTTTYNYGGNRKLIRATINNGGILNINNRSIPSGFANSGIPAPTGQYKGYINGCGVTIENGGLMNVGSTFWSERAEVRVVSGSTLHIKNGGRINIKGYSQLIVEEGGTLIIEDGAMINYWGTNSNNAATLRIEGTLIVQNTSTGMAELIGDGQLQIAEGSTIDIQENSHLWIGGSDRNKTILGLESSLRVDGAARLTLNDGTVSYENASSSIIANNDAVLMMDNITLINTGGRINEGIISSAPNRVMLNDVLFNKVDIGWLLSDGTDASYSRYQILDCTFTHCNEAVSVSNTTALKLDGCTFNGGVSNSSAIFATKVEVLNLIDCNINNYSNQGIFLDEVPIALLKNTVIDNNIIGVNAQNMSNVFLSHGSIMSNNQTAIQMQGDAENGMVTMDCATFDNNTNGIIGTDVLLNIDAEINATDPAYISPNTFKNINFSGGQLFNICYIERDVDNIFMKNNYWDGMASLPSFAYKIYNGASTNGCPNFSNVSLDFSNSVVNLPQGCNYAPTGNTPVYGNPTPGNPTPGNAGIIQFVANPCTLVINNQSYDVEHQYSLGEEEFNEENFDEADLKYVPVSALSGTTRDNSSSNCRHYIDVAEVMVKVEEIMVMQKSGRSAAMDIMSYWDESAKIENEEPILIALTAFPNPASDVLTIKIEDDVTEKGTLTMYNMLGQSVFSTTTYGRITQIGVQEMPAGIYRISWIGENEQLIGKVKVVVK